MEDKIDSINRKVNFIVGVIVVQIIFAIGIWIYVNGNSDNATDDAAYASDQMSY